MGKGLREVAQQLAVAGIGFLGEQSQVVGMSGRPVKPSGGSLDFAGQRQAFDQPVCADKEAAGVAGPAPYQTMIAEFPLDRLDGRPHPIVGRGQETDDRQQQYRGVEVVGAKGARVGAGLLAPGLIDHRAVHLVSGHRPALGISTGTEPLGQLHRPVQRHPAHHLG